MKVMSSRFIPRDGVMIAPSILSSDFLHLEKSVSAVSELADAIHVDVMDGHFVPNLTIGPLFVSSLQQRFAIPLDVHLMVDNPLETCDWYIDAGADIVCAHIEALDHANRFARAVRSRGVMAGIALNPATPVAWLRDIIEEVDLVLVMSVNPGFAAQSFIPSAVRKISELADMQANLGTHAIIEVDGGINAQTAPQVCSAGASMLVAGSAIFSTPDPAASLNEIRLSAQAKN